MQHIHLWDIFNEIVKPTLNVKGRFQAQIQAFCRMC
jgi:hypothetical protein